MINYKNLVKEEYIQKRNLYISPNYLEPISDGWSDATFLNYDKKRSTTYYESIKLDKVINSVLDRVDFSNDYAICDIGCADGRLIHYLLDKGLRNIIGVDINYPALDRLVSSIDPEYQDKYLCLCEDILEINAKQNFDLVFAWGICSLTPNHEKSFYKLAEITKKNGYIVYAEPVLEQKLIYSLIRQDINEFIRIYKEKTRPFVWEERNNHSERYSLNSINYYNKFISIQKQFEIVETGNISALPSLIYGGLLQEIKCTEEIHKHLDIMLSSKELDEINLPRQCYWVLQKK